jgi:hypothetical protein
LAARSSKELADRMAPDDRVLLTGRDPERVHAATAAIAGGQPIARVGRARARRARRRCHRLAGRRAGRGLHRLLQRRIAHEPRRGSADQIDAVAETNNLATTAMLREFAPRLPREGGCPPPWVDDHDVSDEQPIAAGEDGGLMSALGFDRRVPLSVSWSQGPR